MEKIAAIGDLHLGRSLYGYDMTFDVRRVMRSFFEYCQRTGIRTAVQLGDVFDRPNPVEEHRKWFVQWCNEFERAKIRLFVLVGNHDAITRESVSSGLESIGAYSFKYVRIIDRPTYERGLLFLPFPSYCNYQSPEQWEHAVDRLVTEVKHPTIVFSHLDIDGAKLGQQSYVYRGSAYKIPKAVIASKRVTRIFAGHIHKPQFVGDKIIVVGAAQRLRFDEAEDKRMFWLVLDHKVSSNYTYKGKCLLDLEFDCQSANTEKVIKAILQQPVSRALVKLTPTISAETAVDWAAVETAVREAGADLVVTAPIKIRSSEKRRLKLESNDPLKLARQFIKSKIPDRDRQKRLYGIFRKLTEHAD